VDWFPLILAAHIVLAVSLLLPSVLLPFLLRRRAGPPSDFVTRALMAMQGTGTLVIGLGLAATGVAMLAILGPQLVTQPWLLVALVLYAINLGVAAFISRPNLRRLVGLGTNDDPAQWQRRARTQRYVAYGMAAGIGIIGFLMSTKPELW
jgi:hypothetical protein